MKISSATTINELLKAYPFLVDFLVAYNPKFELLKNKVMRATMGRMATLKRVAGIGEVPLDRLILDIAAEIERQTGKSVEVDLRGGKNTVDDEKTAKLKAIIQDLHDGAAFDDVKKRFDDLIADVDATEIAAMEEQLICEGMPAQEVQRLCDLHVGVFKDALDVKDVPDAPPGHPINTFMEENRIFTDVVGKLNGLLYRLKDDTSLETFKAMKPEVESLLGEMAKVDIHYTRKENQLFPFLEKHGVTGPSQVMWGVHDEIRAMLKKTTSALSSDDVNNLVENGLTMTKAVADMVYKEHHILFPLSLEKLGDEEWSEIRKGEADIGYAGFEPKVAWPTTEQRATSDESTATERDTLNLDTGGLSPEQINLILKHLPVDITFVDENDEVRYFSATEERIFPRSPGIIGRQVHKCHPPKSVHVVEKIVEAFKAGKKDVAEFWLALSERFIHIRYFAVRDDAGVYRGVLEVSQDLTDLKKLDGERRLLNWEED